MPTHKSRLPGLGPSPPVQYRYFTLGALIRISPARRTRPAFAGHIRDAVFIRVRRLVGNDAAGTADIEKGRSAAGRNRRQLFAGEWGARIQDVLVELAGDESGAGVRRKEIAAIKGQHVQKPALLGGRSLRLVLVIAGMLAGGAAVVESMNSREEGRIVDHQRERLVQMIDHPSEDRCPTGDGLRNASQRSGVGVTAAIPITIDHHILVRGVLPVRVVEELPISQAKSRFAVRPHDGACGKCLRLAVAGNCPDALAVGKPGKWR